VFIGTSSPAAQKLLAAVQKASRNNLPVLLMGETGTGKEVVARTIHELRGSGRFIPVDCSVLGGPLLESELFGHAKGAFTGASGEKTGLLEEAHGGTAFLDEIGELPLEFQPKLLRAIEQKEFRPVGSTIFKRSDFRIIAATNRDLFEEVKARRFREDLLYRLKVVKIHLPPLRERLEDLPELIHHFLRKYGGEQFKLTESVRATLLSYNWPGNVRELQNCIQYMVGIACGDLLQSSALPTVIQRHGCTTAKNTDITRSERVKLSSDASMQAQSRDPVPLCLTEVERRAILHALNYTLGDKARAAKLLGIGRATLYRKLKEYAIA